MSKPVRVLIVDDSSIIRNLFVDILGSDPDIEVVGAAVDAFDAREKIKALNPDVVTLDIEMPKMDGLSFLEKIMTLRPTPVIMVSSLTQKGAAATLRALEIGAVDYVSKNSSRSFDAQHLSEELIMKVKTAARAKMHIPQKFGTFGPSISTGRKYASDMIIAIGSSTGGVEALRDVVTGFPPNTPPVLITQHMPPKFTTTFAARLNELSSVTVTEAKQGDLLEVGHVYIAPGDFHLELERKGTRFYCKITDTEKVSGHKPSVDVLFESVAKYAGSKAVGAILTGMGKDGAKGMLSMKKAGAMTFGQDEATCVVYGMPKAAFLAGAVEKQVPLEEISGALLKAVAVK